MAITAKQFHYLNTMGVSLWQRRDGIYADEKTTADKTTEVTKAQAITPEKSPAAKVVKQTETTAVNDSISVTIDELLNKPMFIDILKALNIAAKDLVEDASGLNLDNFYWLFSQEQNIQYQDKKLITPTIEVISQNSQLKQELWNVFTDLLNAKTDSTDS
ncbi:DNA polymerase III subunit psi [Thalassomonas sp. M1454]|uniref:DNA polymerase III subunit psi n=1 Tax=Thalassomonas sp. M1454 TaxID=2594477 RepID=UPI00118102FC|nr:DNA polymerase III subunit psi [Thalassomonas sp. M1454]TRX55761.1 DNA polymerase III subunit psi [Thalassomonas sp. M1454]